MSYPPVAPKLSPAKPYEGQSQHQAIGAAVRKFVAAEIFRTRFDFGPYPEVHVRGGGRIYAGKGPRDKKIWCEVATFRLNNRRSNQSAEAENRLRIGQNLFVEALEIAGWTVEPQTERNGDTSFLVYGPGLEEWAIDMQAREIENSEREIERKRILEGDKDEMRAILTRLGLPNSHIDTNHSTPVVSLTLSSLRTIEATIKQADRLERRPIS